MERKMQKIVILSERLPYPPTSGTKNLLYNYCKILHECFHLEVVNISFTEQDDDITLKPDFISKTYLLPAPSNITKLKNLLYKTLLLRKYPIQVSLFWDKKIKKEIFDILDKEQPDFLIADFVRTTEYLKDYPIYKIADLQDLLSLRYERQLKVDLASVNPYGAYLFRLPKFAQQFLQMRTLKKLVMKTEIKLLKKFEVNVGEQYDRVMFVAENEGRIFDKMTGKEKSLIVPLGVDVEFFSQNLFIERIPHSIAFMGALNVAHNENGILHFINDVFPLVLSRIPDARLLVVGGGITENLKKAANEHVEFTGRVEDVRTVVGACEVFVCPLQFGSGIKTKNLEAMAMGVPVVTTTIGAENIHAVNGRDWIVADDNQDFADQVVRLMEEPELRQMLRQNAQDFVQSNFTWKVAEKQFKQLFADQQTGN